MPARIQKVLSGDTSYVDSFKEEKLWLPSGYTGHAPKAREVLATTRFGPAEGHAYHGPLGSGTYDAPRATNQWAIAP